MNKKFRILSVLSAVSIVSFIAYIRIIGATSIGFIVDSILQIFHNNQ